MIKVKIGSEERNLEDVTPGWIKEQIIRRRRDGETICVRVFIEKDPLHMSLSTTDCPATAGPRRLPKPQERRVFELWDRLGLNEADFAAGQLIAFLKQVSN